MTKFVSTAAWALARKEKSLVKNKAKVTQFCDRRSDSQRSSPYDHYQHISCFPAYSVADHYSVNSIKGCVRPTVFNAFIKKMQKLEEYECQKSYNKAQQANDASMKHMRHMYEAHV